MPHITERSVGLAFDMNGCPNRCRHCWLGPGSQDRLSESDVRWGAGELKKSFRQSDNPVEAFSVATWFREPDHSDDYRHLFELETELSDTEPERFELLSIWRLANDPEYAEWAQAIGTRKCQITLFGMEDTTDWFYRRKGAFRDALTATERLTQVGIKPRWQVFLTTKLLSETHAFTDLMDSHGLLHQDSDEHEVFLHLPGPDYEARRIEQYRPEISQTGDLPAVLLSSTRKHFHTDTLWYSEEDLLKQIIHEENEPGERVSLPDKLWLFICSNWDVYSNIGTLEKWWLLGNLKEDGARAILDAYEMNGNMGLQALFSVSEKYLAYRYGNPGGKKIYSNAESLLSLYRARYCEEK